MKYFKNKGFTLLEVLVALAILAIALAAVMKVSIENTENIRYLRDKTLAHWVAMNVLAEISIMEKWPRLGKQEGTAMMADREWFWQMTISETADKELRRLNVQIYYDNQDEESVTMLIGFVGKP
ncbi:type II secretion system minor pseudopilin GspI [Candidatus Parabeggiatoa sp. HSG14]|uniref:type II secretion system minor pseudopilin GspI n=1 Tax=Candidatus Parabeggiatoa sp. HSG14 TaxID=3055593 RepID=UPI0025A7F48E|nr:type II secretion system minor pseudopilin GspI [Thiotrichales bacterium HSG14]